MFGKLVNIFVDTGTATEQAPAKENSKVPVAAQVKAPGPVGSVVPVPVVTVNPASISLGQVDQDMLKILEEAIEAANIPGFDYLEFRTVLSNMAQIPMPEQQKYQAAFAAAQSQGISKQQLIEAVNFYMNVVETKSTEFHEMAANVQATEVDSKTSQISELELKITEAANQIQQLTTQINSMRQEQDQIRVEQSTSEYTLRNKVAAFEATKNSVVQRLTSDLNKITAYIA